MSEQDYFKSALSDFTHEAASGGAIRHLADLGYTVSQITKQLTFPTPPERVRREVWERLLDTGVILLEEPGGGTQRERAVYVEEHDPYGRTSFRRVARAGGDSKRILWKERRFGEDQVVHEDNAAWGSRNRQGGKITGQGEGRRQGKGRELAAYLAEKCAGNGENQSYCSCNFGLLRREKPAGFMAAMDALDERQKDYIQGLPWEKRICYHRLDLRMREIVARLYENESYGGAFYFLKTEEKVLVGPQHGSDYKCRV